MRRLTAADSNGGGRASRGALFPQVLRIVEAYVSERVDLHGAHPSEIGLQTYAQRIAGILADAIKPNDSEGEAPLLPLLNRYEPIGSTARVHFKTVRPVRDATASHLNRVACDTGTWEQAAMFQIEKLAERGTVECYVRNDHLEFNIPYELYGRAARLRTRLHRAFEQRCPRCGRDQGQVARRHGREAPGRTTLGHRRQPLGTPWRVGLSRLPRSAVARSPPDGNAQRKRQARIREAAARVHEQAEREVAKLRAQGWKRDDFARALGDLLGADSHDTA